MSEVKGYAEREKHSREHAIKDYFLLTSDLSPLNFLFEACEKLTGPARNVADVFVSNLIAVYVTASAVPVFARQTAHQAAVLTMLGVATAVDVTTLPGKDAKRHERVRKALDKDLSNSPWKERSEKMSEQMSEDNLSTFLEQQPARNAADQVLRQCTVLTWSDFEVLASDLFLMLINANPKLSGLLLKDERTKRLYQVREFVIALEEYEYDLSRSM